MCYSLRPDQSRVRKCCWLGFINGGDYQQQQATCGYLDYANALQFVTRILNKGERMNVQKLGLVLFLGCVSLAGCSSKPEISDIEPGLKEGWADCSGLKLADLKKTNGVDHGSSYEITVSYKLQVLKDVTAEEAWQTNALCPDAWGAFKVFWAYGKIDRKYGNPLKAGDAINVNETYTMVKSEKGWILK